MAEALESLRLQPDSRLCHEARLAALGTDLNLFLEPLALQLLQVSLLLPQEILPSLALFKTFQGFFKLFGAAAFAALRFFLANSASRWFSASSASDKDASKYQSPRTIEQHMNNMSCIILYI